MFTLTRQAFSPATAKVINIFAEEKNSPRFSSDCREQVRLQWRIHYLAIMFFHYTCVRISFNGAALSLSPPKHPLSILEPHLFARQSILLPCEDVSAHISEILYSSR